jgi:hypothetical protein
MEEVQQKGPWLNAAFWHGLRLCQPAGLVRFAGADKGPASRAVPGTKDKGDRYQINPEKPNHSASSGCKTRITRMSLKNKPHSGKCALAGCAAFSWLVILFAAFGRVDARGRQIGSGAGFGAPVNATGPFQLKDEMEAADADVVAVVKRGLAAQALTIHERAVGAAEVGERDFAATDAEQAMVTANGGHTKP